MLVQYAALRRMYFFNRKVNIYALERRCMVRFYKLLLVFHAELSLVIYAGTMAWMCLHDHSDAGAIVLRICEPGHGYSSACSGQI